MVAAQIAKSMSPGLFKVADRARRDSSFRFNSLAHLIDVDLLRSAYKRLNKAAAVGIDKVTYGDYTAKSLAPLRQSCGLRLPADRECRQCQLRS